MRRTIERANLFNARCSMSSIMAHATTLKADLSLAAGPSLEVMEKSAAKIQAHYRGKRDRAIVEVQRVKAEVSGRFSARLSKGDSSTPSRSSSAAPDDSSPRIQPVSPPPSPPSPTAATEVSPKARRGPQRSLTSAWTHKEVALVASLQRMLPWLRVACALAGDRR